MDRESDNIPPADIARALVRRCRSATLATALTGKRQGWPYASLVTVACAPDASPIMLLSTLADHTRNLVQDSRASLLFEEASVLSNPQTGPRVTLTGRLRRTADASLRRRFLSRHPEAELYAGFADFSFYSMKVERAHFVGGFGRANWMGANKFLLESKKAKIIAEVELKLLKRLNTEFMDTLSRIAGKPVRNPWIAYGLDPEGVDIVRNNRFKRIEFDKAIESSRGMTTQIKKMRKK